MNLLITGAWQGAAEHMEEILNMGHKVHFLQWEKDSLPCDPEWVEGIIGNGIFLSHDIRQFVNLRWIQLTSAGFDRVPIDYIKEHDIEIHNARGVYSIPMAEYAVAGVLQLYKQMDFFRENQREHQWEKHRGLMELSGKRVCIVGCGSIGTECAKRFKAFGCEVVGVNRTVKVLEHYDAVFGMQELKAVLKRSDIVVLTLPLTEETYHIFGEEEFGCLEADAILVNISRGAVLDTHAMERNIGRIRGAVLDVFEEEPLPADSILWNSERVVITPHISFIGEKNAERMCQRILTDLTCAARM